MTPKEILAECPELELRPNVLGELCMFSEKREMGAYIPKLIALSLAQSRKEARDLREENDHLKRQLYWFTGGPVND